MQNPLTKPQKCDIHQNVSAQMVNMPKNVNCLLKRSHFSAIYGKFIASEKYEIYQVA